MKKELEQKIRKLNPQFIINMLKKIIHKLQTDKICILSIEHLDRINKLIKANEQKIKILEELKNI